MKLRAKYNGIKEDRVRTNLLVGKPYILKAIFTSTIKTKLVYQVELSIDLVDSEELIHLKYDIDAFFMNWKNITWLSDEETIYDGKTRLNFGKYAGEMLQNIPVEYLQDLYINNTQLPSGLNKYILWAINKYL